MLQCVPDSEDEGIGALSEESINTRRLAQNISLLPDNIRQSIINQIGVSKYSHLYKPPETTAESDSEIVSSSQESNIDLIDIPSLIKNGPQSLAFSKKSNNRDQHVPHDSIAHESEIRNRELAQEAEDAENLQTFLETNQFINTSRRGLRKRNFASTHPYLTDQAQYLGLCKPQQLNNLYEETPDIEKIVKYLNSAYLQRKKQNPHEYRFKAKNFYSFLGKGSRRNKQDSSQAIPTQNREDSQSQSQSQNAIASYDDPALSADDNNYLSSDSDLSNDDLLPLPKHPSPLKSQSNQDDFAFNEPRSDRQRPSILDLNESSTDSDENDIGEGSQAIEEAMVRVGGRYRKLKSVLHGALPESAKRLEMWKPKSKSKRKSPLRVSDHRKGLAVKKYGSSRNQNNELEQELKTFVDDQNYYDVDTSVYQSTLPFENSADIYHRTSSEYGPENGNHNLVYSNLSDSESEPERLFSETFNRSAETTNINYESDIQETHSNFLVEDLVDSDDSLIEEDHIDPLFAYTASKPKLKSKPKTYKNGRNTHQENLTKTSITNQPKSSNTTTSSRTNGHRKKKHKTLDTFGNLQKKRITKPLKRKALSAIADHNQKKQPKIMSEPKKTAKNPMEMLLNSYYFRRDPTMFTTVFEAEKEPKLVKPHFPNFDRSKLSFPHSSNFLDLQYGDRFPSDSILQVIDIEKVNAIPYGQDFSFLGDLVFFDLFGHSYSFLLVNKTSANENCERYFYHLRKVLFDPRVDGLENLTREIYQSVKGVLKWLLILQERPSDKSWRCLQNILNEYSKFKQSGSVIKSMIFHPHMILIYHVFRKLHESTTSDALADLPTETYRIDYWCNFLQFFDLDDLKAIHSGSEGNNLYLLESLYCIYLLLKEKSNCWWPSINEALWRVVSLKAQDGQLLSIFYILATMIPNKYVGWQCFQGWYLKFQDTDESDNHNDFLDIIYLLNQRLGWGLEEKLVTNIYSVITKRKFANFSDEPNSYEIIGQIRTRDDIPDNCFFDRFMQFLYFYVSGLPVDFNKKRLISKLITSSQYHYEEGRTHFAMYVNRMNLVLLLSQISDLDLNNQFDNLLEQVSSSGDVKIYEQALKGLLSYSDIALNKTSRLPSTGYSIFFNIILKNYNSVMGVQKLWRKFSRRLEIQFAQTQNLDLTFEFFSFIMDIDFKKMPEEIALFTVKTSLLILNLLIKSKEVLSKSHLTTLKVIEEKIISLANLQMGRFPIPNDLTESRVVTLVECCIQVWNRSTFLSRESNWNTILLQKFPYLGNQLSRERFILYLYNDLLSFVNLREHIETITVIVLKDLACHESSPYLLPMISLLNKNHYGVFTLKNMYIPWSLTPKQIQLFKTQIMSNIILNIKNDAISNQKAKAIYLLELVDSIDKGYTHFFLDESYVEFCKQTVESIYKNCKQFIHKTDKFWNLSSKLGFPYNSNEIKWRSTNSLEKLAIVHREFLTSLHFKKDYKCILKQYLTSEFNHVMFQLFFIYLKALNSQKGEQWALMSYYLEFIQEMYCCTKINVTDNAHRIFLQQLVFLPYIRLENSSNANYEIYQWKVMRSTFQILHSCTLIFDGYRDKSWILNLVEETVSVFKGEFEPKIDLPYTTYSLYDIFTPNSVIYHPQTEFLDEDVALAKEEAMKSLLRLEEKTYSIPSNEVLLFDLDFDVL